VIPICHCGGVHTPVDCPELSEESLKGTLRFLSEMFRAEATKNWDRGDRQASLVYDLCAAASLVYDLCAAELEKRWMP
jgi:hypothetical protein